MNDRVFDVIIIGAGSVGVPAAFFFAQAGLRTLVIDRFASVGQGSNKAAIGGIRATHSDPAKIQICLDSIRIFSTWEAHYGDNIEWVAGGYCFVAYREQEARALKELLKIQSRYGLNIDWLDRDDLLEVVPALNPNGLIGGTFSPDDGSASPMRSLLACYHQAVRHGARFHFRETVTGILTRHGRVAGVRTDQDTYHAGTVINAAGPWATQVAAMAGLEVSVTPDSHEAGISEPVQPFLRPMLVDIRPTEDSANYYFYQHATGQIVFCITPQPAIVGTDRRETSAFLPQVSRRMVDLVPRLRHLRIRRTWRGLYPMTPDGFPIVGEAPELPGYIYAVGMCGQGYMLGPGLGLLLVRMVQGNLSEHDREAIYHLRPDRTFAGHEKLQ
jgi:sarcosine oxidase, subunit beta